MEEWSRSCCRGEVVEERLWRSSGRGVVVEEWLSRKEIIKRRQGL